MSKATTSKADAEKPNRGLNAVTKRRKMYSIPFLKKQVGTLEGLLIDFQAAISVAENNSIKEIMVDGSTKFERAANDLISYITYVRMGIARITLGGSTPDQLAKAAAVGGPLKRK